MVRSGRKFVLDDEMPLGSLTGAERDSGGPGVRRKEANAVTFRRERNTPRAKGQDLQYVVH